MRVLIENDRVDLEDGAIIGQGGEGRVYRIGQRALKIFHATPKEKADKLRDFPRGLPRGKSARSTLRTSRRRWPWSATRWTW